MCVHRARMGAQSSAGRGLVNLRPRERIGQSYPAGKDARWIHPCRMEQIDSVKINPSLVMMREWNSWERWTLAPWHQAEQLESFLGKMWSLLFYSHVGLGWGAKSFCERKGLRFNCTGNGVVLVVLMKEEILRLNNCLVLQLGGAHNTKSAEFFKVPLLPEIIIWEGQKWLQ